MSILRTVFVDFLKTGRPPVLIANRGFKTQKPKSEKCSVMSLHSLGSLCLCTSC